MAKDTKNKVKSEKKDKTFFKDFKAELKKVTWPTAKQLVQKTAVVIVIVLIISAIVFVLDNAFSTGYKFIITESSKLVKHEENNNNASETNNENNNETQNTTTDDSANTVTEGNETSTENSTNGEVPAE